MRFRGRKTKVCPRCKNQCLIADAQCDDCGLVFARLDEATNKIARKRFRNKEKEQVVYVKKCPPDKKRWVLILLTVLFGLMGAEYYYVGRWKMGLMMTLFNIATILCGTTAFFNTQLNILLGESGMAIIGVVVGIYAFVWLNDIRRVCFGTFLIPVSLMTKAEEREEKELQELKKKYLEEKKDLKKISKEIENKAEGKKTPKEKK